jgi:hypothetical protein
MKRADNTGHYYRAAGTKTEVKVPESAVTRRRFRAFLAAGLERVGVPVCCVLYNDRMGVWAEAAGDRPQRFLSMVDQDHMPPLAGQFFGDAGANAMDRPGNQTRPFYHVSASTPCDRVNPRTYYTCG